MTPHGASIRAIRGTQGRSLRDLAMAARISLSFLAQIERGEKQASQDVTKRIACALAVPVDAITREDPVMTTVAEADEDLRLFTLKQVAGLWGISLSYLQKAVAARAIEYTNFDPLKSGKGRALMSREQIRKVMADSVSKPLTGPRR